MRKKILGKAQTNIFKSLSTTTRSPNAPKPILDIKRIREDPEAFRQNCLHRNYLRQSTFPAQIVSHSGRRVELQHGSRNIREKYKSLQQKIAQGSLYGPKEAYSQMTSDLDDARTLKDQLTHIEAEDARLRQEIEDLALELPNVTSESTPIGEQPNVLRYINGHGDAQVEPESQRTKSHVDIGAELDIIDFRSAAVVGGWGSYHLKHDGVHLERALVQYAIDQCEQEGFEINSPTEMVYSYMSSACGFRPRDQGGEQQIYTIEQDTSDRERGKPELSLAGTAEIVFASMKANTVMQPNELPVYVAGPSRCFRAEAGARGTDAKGLYRVHVFTKVEMFGWTMPGLDAERLFHKMVAIQSRILGSLGLYCRVLEQPSADLGASASRKQDIEALFPSRRSRNNGWGELTSVSICTDYQTRRLATRVFDDTEGRYIFPYTVNGTAMAVPRVFAAILENHWDEREECVRIPEVLWPYMKGKKEIRRRQPS